MLTQSGVENGLVDLLEGEHRAKDLANLGIGKLFVDHEASYRGKPFACDTLSIIFMKIALKRLCHPVGHFSRDAIALLVVGVEDKHIDEAHVHEDKQHEESFSNLETTVY